MNKFDIGLLVLRMAFGLSMMCHGWNKFSSSSGLSGTAQWFRSIGMKWPRFQARLAAISEVAAGFLMAVGFLTGLSSTIFVALMVVAIVTVHARVGYFIFLPNGGWEYCASIIAVATTLSLTGPGRYSLDHALALSNICSTWALPVGLALALCHVAITYRPQKQTK